MALEFNGSSSRVAFPSGFFNYERTQPWSISANVYFTGARSGGVAGYIIFSRLQSSGALAGIEVSLLWTELAFSPNSIIAANVYMINNFGSNNHLQTFAQTDVASSTWTNVVFTYDGSSAAAGVKIYINGTASAKTTPRDTLSASVLNSITPTIGSRNASSSWFNGRIAEAGIWNVELTADECRALGKSVSPTLVRPQSLQSYVPMVREIIDAKGNALTGTSTTVANHPRVYR